MRHLRIFESFKEENRLSKFITNICNKYHIYNYTINEDGSINVNETVSMPNKGLTSLPLYFRNVSGHFNCSVNKLTTLKYGPEAISGDFNCVYNKLTSLEGAPKSVGGDFNCSYNKLTSLKGCPKSVSDNFYCTANNIVTFEYLPLSIGGDFYCRHNPIFEVWKLFEDYSKIEFLNDCDALREPDADSEQPIIILDRLNYFLEEIGKKAVKRVKGYKCI